MAVKFGMTIAEIIAQLTRGFRSVAGRNPDGLEKIKIQQEAVQRFKEMNKIVDMQGRTLDPSKTIMGGTQEGAALKSGIMKATGAKPIEARADISKYIKDGKPDNDKLNALVDRDMILKEEADSLATTGKNYERFQKISAERKNIREIIEDVRKMFPEDMAQGGRAGFDNGGLLSMLDIQGEGSKTGKQQIPGAPEGITMDEETYNFIVNADIPIGEKINLLTKYGRGKGRTRIEKDDQELFLGEGGSRTREIGLDFNPDAEKGFSGNIMYNPDSDDVRAGITYKFAQGGRAGFKIGSIDKARRAFLKTVGAVGAGIGALKTGILGLTKGAAPVATEAVKSAGSTASAPPPYFFKLMEKIKFFGKKSKVGPQERVHEFTYTGKDGSDYVMTEDIVTGDIKITKDKTGVGTYGDKSYDTIEDRTEMVFRKGQADETTKGKTPPDEYDEYKVEFDQDGTAADATDIDEISKMEIVEEAGDPDSLTLKKAGGGRAGYFLGGKVSIKILNFLKDKKKVKEAYDNIFPTGDYKYDADMVAESLVENNPKVFGNRLYEDLTDAERSAVYGAGLEEASTNFAKQLKLKRAMDKASKPTKTLEGIEKTGTIDISDDAIAEEFATFMKETDPVGHAKIQKVVDDANQKIELKRFKTKGRKPNASGGIARMLGE